jgi:hypothetical protein
MHRYQKFISDIAGQDIHSHDGEVGQLIEQVATWLRDAAQDLDVPGGRAIAAEFKRVPRRTAVPHDCHGEAGTAHGSATLCFSSSLTLYQAA